MSKLYDETTSDEEIGELEAFIIDAANTRDAFMAEHVAWILQHEQAYYGTGAMLVTGHNGHIMKSSMVQDDYTFIYMGKNLMDAFQEEYYAIGTDFAKGSFYALNEQGNLRSFEIDDMLPLSQHLFEDENPVSFVDLSDCAPVFHLPQQMHMIGASFSEEWERDTTLYIPSELYDALFYFQEVHAFSRIG